MADAAVCFPAKCPSIRRRGHANEVEQEARTRRTDTQQKFYKPIPKAKKLAHQVRNELNETRADGRRESGLIRHRQEPLLPLTHAAWGAVKVVIPHKKKLRSNIDCFENVLNL